MNQKQCRLRIFVVVIALLIALGSIPATAVDEEVSINELIAAQAQAVEANRILMQYFYANGEGYEYPDYFSSCYIEDNILHIRLVSPTSEQLSLLTDVLSDYKNDIVFEYGAISQTDAQNLAVETAAELMEQGIEVAHWYVEAKTGNIIIGVISEDIHSANQLVNQNQTYSLGSSYPQIIIEEGEYTQPTETQSTDNVTMFGGIELSVSENGNTASRSSGICGYYRGKRALVTCGHGIANVGSTIIAGGKEIGELVYKQYTAGELGDYAIIELNGNADFSHIIGNSTHGYTTVDDGMYPYPAVGTIVTRYGAKSGYSYGTVVETNVSITPFGNSYDQVRGLVKVSLLEGQSILGDSGGPYLVGNAFCGVHHGSNNSNSNIMYFTPYSIIAQSGFTAVGAHTCTRWSNSDSSNHSGYCLICKDTVYEAHYKYWDDLEGKCTRCGRSGSITGIQ